MNLAYYLIVALVNVKVKFALEKFHEDPEGE
jgi:hypothetical protein